MTSTLESLPTERVPDFLLIGAMKSGTTTLHTLLGRHPRLYMCEPKEPAFFSRDDRYELGLPWYSNLFSEAGAEQMCGESSTCYSRFSAHPNAASRIAKHLPNARLVFLMRHPVDRLYSHYIHRMTERFNRDQGPVVSLERALDEIPEIKEASLYEFQLQKFEAYFDRDSFLLLSTDELKRDPSSTAQKVHTFLGLPPLAPDSLGAENQRSNMFKLEAADGAFYRLRRSSKGRALARVLPDSLKAFARPALKAALRAAHLRTKEGDFKAEISPLTKEQRAALLNEFREPNEALSNKWNFTIPSNWHE